MIGMAKRASSRSQTQADDTATAGAASPRPRTRRPRTETSASPADAAIASSTSSASNETRDEGPNEDDIRLRAYHRYLQRGGGDGMDFEDWLEAERELKSRKFEV
jgi:DUF2934 family protein